MQVAFVVIGLMAVLGLSYGQDDCFEKFQMAACTSCSDPPVRCYDCASGYAVNKDKDGCEKCNENCDECRMSSGTDPVCMSCNAGYRFDDGDCIACIANCAKDKCISDTECEECQPNYQMLSTGECETCSISNCEQCTFSSDTFTCSTCVTGYYLDNGASPPSCQTCMANCYSCTAKDTCAECNDGYQLSETKTCIKMQGGCETSKNTLVSDAVGAKCEKCKDGYYLDGDVCTACAYGCKTCTADEGCSACLDLYAKKANKDDRICNACPANCKECTLAQILDGKCTTCVDGYYLNSEKCEKCPTTCSKCKSTTECTACNTGYQLFSQQCVPDVANCNSTGNWYNDTEAKAYCSGCATGFVVTDDLRECKACGVGCAGYCGYNSTDDKTECWCSDGSAGDTSDNRGGCPSATFVCKDGYYYDTSGTNNGGFPNCEPCGTGCKDCNATDKDVCLACKDGYSLRTSGSCSLCNSKCETCTHDGTSETCTLCKDGSYLNAGACLDCAVSNCLQCTSTACSKRDCDTGCKECVDGSKSNCTECNTGYVLKADKCEPCPDNCATCSLDGQTIVCDSCPDNFVDNQELCTPCSTNCLKCTYAEGKVSNSEAKGAFYLTTDDKTCLACQSNCLDCRPGNDGSTTCAKCQSDYTLSSDRKSCIPCSNVAGCIRCKDATSDGSFTCTNCSSEYTISSDWMSCHKNSQFPQCTEVVDYPAECDACDSNEAWELEEDEYGDKVFPKLCTMSCLSCGTYTINDDNTTLVTGEADDCNPKEPNITTRVPCPDGVCFVAIDLQDGDVTKAARGCLRFPDVNVKSYRDAIAVAKKKKDQVKERTSCRNGDDGNAEHCLKVCFEADDCNGGQFNGAGTLYGSVLIVLVALVYSISLTL